MAKKRYCNGFFYIKHIWVREDEDKRMVKLDFIFVQNFPYWAYIKKKTHSFFVAWSFLLVHI